MMAQARRESVHVIGPFRDDGISASRFAKGKVREGWRQTMQAVVSGEATELWTWEISRATRDRPVWAGLINACIANSVLINVGGRLHDPLDADDGFMLDLQAALAVRESAVTSKRIRRDVAARAAQGKPHGKIPYGYTREYDPKTRALLRQIPDLETAPILEEMARRVLAGEAMNAIAIDLNERGVPTPEEVRARRVHGDDELDEPGRRKLLWRGDEVRDQLKSPTPAGMRVHNGVVVADAEWPAIISPADHAALVAILSAPGRRAWFGPVKHLLTGIATCGVCGAPLRAVKNRGYPSYACWGRDRRGASCVARVRAPLDAMVTVHVVEQLSDPAFLSGLASKSASEEQHGGQVARELADLNAKLAQFEASAMAATGIEAASFGRVIAGLATQIEAKKQEVGRASRMPPAVLALAGPGAAAGWEAFANAGDVAALRQIVRALVRVVVNRSTLPHGVRGFDESTIDIIDL